MSFDPAALYALLALCAEPGTWTALLAGLTTEWGIAVSLFAAGLISGVTHCSGMCGPFVLMRLASHEGGDPAREAAALVRLRRAALWRYHLGRGMTYCFLGAAAAGAAGAAFECVGFRWVVAAILVVATIGLVAAALRSSGLIGRSEPRMGGYVSNVVTVLAGRAARIGDFPLGLALGLLPCGVVYGALAAAASTANPLAGALAMAAFALGTFPGLFAVGLGGAFFARRLRGAKAVVLPLAALNIAIVTGFVLKAIA